MFTIAFLTLLSGVAPAADPAKDREPKPKIAFFPIAGTAKESLREKVWDALRAKLDRTQVYEVIDGPQMIDVVGEAKDPITFNTEPAAVKELAATLDAKVIVWGEMNGSTLKLKILDLREKEPKPRTVEKAVVEPTDLRFVNEQILESLPGVGKFEHPVEESVSNDAEAAALWDKNPNLVNNGDFSKAGGWEGILQSERYEVVVSDNKPAVDKVNIYRLKDGSRINNVLSMTLSFDTAQATGLACLSAPIPIDDSQRYRLKFRYNSTGPVLHVFVKGYTMEKNIKGETVERECYRRQVPPSPATGGKWAEIIDDMNPQNVTFPVTHVRIDLYAYLGEGFVMFDDVMLKAVGKKTHVAHDEAIKLSTTKPAKGKSE